MKLVRMRTLGVFGLGFLAGSRAGHGPWEKAQATMEQLKGKMAGTSMGGAGPTSSNGSDGRRSPAGSQTPESQGNPQMTEI
ncbi:MAG TPA: hypothetical protein VJ622_10040 [Acidimicrobiia bacterium]|nr:hypothetical protein [Acidimicrobiia bacterium]HKN90612.1 hypothetical protein [Acidimicrobiia bacterium]HMC81548.1 hypothetical protein [Acidimicrobiia bacterium]HTC80946.1 hypothetical protein [Acidimicrobiia bacterium]